MKPFDARVAIIQGEQTQVGTIPIFFVIEAMRSVKLAELIVFFSID